MDGKKEEARNEMKKSHKSPDIKKPTKLKKNNNKETEHVKINVENNKK